ncbi:C-C motif chemokine 5-like [Spea bombifrons]|uniref:C-C motif chemokine 5-like n=1 Tax=Spea bombifrons TaxID=233779 RepID=UPI002349AEA5|nr:C-C motif chemokine 5-like [Spea bombifrons]
MKLTLLTITILFALVFFKEAHSAPVGSDVVSCCFGYMEKAIPRKHVVHYFYTSGRCTQRAVVLITRKNQKLCANPETKWVQDHINYLEMRDN